MHVALGSPSPRQSRGFCDIERSSGARKFLVRGAPGSIRHRSASTGWVAASEVGHCRSTARGGGESLLPRRRQAGILERAVGVEVVIKRAARHVVEFAADVGDRSGTVRHENRPEYVNRTVAVLLNKLHVRDFTKSRPRRSTENALVEGKNANVVQRFLGHDHIPQRFAPLVDAFARERLSPYLNHHRLCLFATDREGANGRIRRVYWATDVQAPFDKLRSLPGADACLKPGVSFAELDAQARAVSDLQAARAPNAERTRLFQTIAGLARRRVNRPTTTAAGFRPFNAPLPTNVCLS